MSEAPRGERPVRSRPVEEEVSQLLAELCVVATEGGDLVSARLFADGYRELRRHDARGHLLLGTVELAAGRPWEAEKHFFAGIDRDPDCHQAEVFVAECQLAQGRQAEAKSRLRRIALGAPATPHGEAAALWLATLGEPIEDGPLATAA